MGKIPWRRERLPTPVFLGFPGGSAGKESTCHVGDLGSIPGLGRSPGEGKGCPLQYCGLEKWTVYPWGRKDSDTTERLSLPALVTHSPAHKGSFSFPDLDDTPEHAGSGDGDQPDSTSAMAGITAPGMPLWGHCFSQKTALCTSIPRRGWPAGPIRLPVPKLPSSQSRPLAKNWELVFPHRAPHPATVFFLALSLLKGQIAPGQLPWERDPTKLLNHLINTVPFIRQ